MLDGRLGPSHGVPAGFFAFVLGMVDRVLRAAVDSVEVKESKLFSLLLFFMNFNFKFLLL